VVSVRWQRADFDVGAAQKPQTVASP
jgi:hypothetical protein